MDVLIIGIIISAIVILIAFVLALLSRGDFSDETAIRRAGRTGEQFATQLIREILQDGDVLLTNVELTYQGKRTELDQMIINSRGVFIIEVKNYSGTLIGDEEDYEWIKNKVTDAGSVYQKTLKNPIHQVKRQIYILSGRLKELGIRVWVEGYVFFVEQNSPVESEYVLDTRGDIDRVIHRGCDHKLSKTQQQRIIDAFMVASERQYDTMRTH